MTTPYFQNDPRWEKKALGLNPSATIRDFGCLLTSMTMVANHFGGNYTPDSYNELMKANGGFSPGQQWLKTFAITKLLPNVKYQKSVECPDKPAPLAEIDAGLAAGSLVIVNVDRDAKDTVFSPADGHWVVIHKKQGNDDYLIWDPYKSDGASNTLVGRYGFGYKTAAQIIKQAIWFGVGDFPPPTAAPPAPPAPPPPPSAPEPKPDKAGKMAPAPSLPTAVQPTVDQLALRHQPVSNPTNIAKLLSSNTVLAVLEGADKVGQQHQWVKVRDGQGVEGYVAAWFVKGTTAAPPPPPPTTTTAVPSAPPPAKANALAVVTMGDQIALRSKPVVASDTLIRYIPKGTRLTVIEGGDAAAKIGAQNQWLQVQAADGTAGYVAAWLVNQAG